MSGPTRRALRVGLTGPIGCGKSTIAHWLAERPGVVAIDGDRVVRDVLAPGTTEVAAVYQRFGEGLRAADGGLDRAALGRIVFADPAALRDMESIVHPAVRPRILAAVAEAERAGAGVVVIEAIKLVEGGLAALCDAVWLVACDPDVQRQRLIGRGTTPADAEARIAAQGDLVGRSRPSATTVIDTGGSAADTRASVERQLEEDLAGRGAARPT